jgi:xanthine/CO dehydrogenase XdhC/CoxF family maturation factor
MESIYRNITVLLDNGEAGALCTIIGSSGSTPRHEGSKMLVFSDGHFVGTVGGGENVDIEGLPELVKTDFAYLGVIGSKRRWSITRKAILQMGVPAELVAKIHAPLGLELNAETPEEIAVSIMAEIIMLRNGGTGKPMHTQVEVQ